MDLATWKIDDLTSRDAYEALLERLGGPALTAQRELVRVSRARLQGALTPDQRALYLDGVDALSDVAALREEAAVRAALALGVGLGSALAHAPHAPASAVLETASCVTCAVLGSRLPHAEADAVARAALDGLLRLPIDSQATPTCPVDAVATAGKA